MRPTHLEFFSAVSTFEKYENITNSTAQTQLKARVQRRHSSLTLSEFMTLHDWRLAKIFSTTPLRTP